MERELSKLYYFMSSLFSSLCFWGDIVVMCIVTISVGTRIIYLKKTLSDNCVRVSTVMYMLQ